jgi:hypothetical protein
MCYTRRRNTDVLAIQRPHLPSWGLARASTTCCEGRGKAWMAGTRPAMTTIQCSSSQSRWHWSHDEDLTVPTFTPTRYRRNCCAGMSFFGSHTGAAGSVRAQDDLQAAHYVFSRTRINRRRRLIFPQRALCWSRPWPGPARSRPAGQCRAIGTPLATPEHDDLR